MLIRPVHLLKQQLFWLLFFSFTVTAQQPENELATLQQQIKATEQKLRQQQRELADAEKTLQQADRLLADASAKVLATEQELVQIQQQERQLLAEQQSLAEQFRQQEALLAEQIKSAYSLGKHDYAKLLLNQQDTSKLERVLAYYQYFNQARLTQLAEINQIVSQLQQVISSLSEKQQQLQATLATLQQQQQQHLQAKQQQQQSVQQLQALLLQQGSELDYLRQNEQGLQVTIEQLRRQTQTLQLTGLDQEKGKLQWPTQGRLLQRFGERRQGGISARGIVIQGNEGNPVSAIADGRVIYADWLKGYGWVIVLDHGAGFMSLYGHNQNLLKQPGDYIRAGDSIALIGASGGQSSSGLYFEIRNKGEAVDPAHWLN